MSNGQTEIHMRLVVDGPVPGVLHSLQDKKSKAVDPKRSASGESLSFDFTIRIAPGPKFYGEQVRSEGHERRFVYIAVGRQAGGHDPVWSRRMKIDIHDIPQALLDGAMAGKRLVGTVAGAGKDGTPACATVRVESWTLI
jgi:Family of unknown function (DUF5990)